MAILLTKVRPPQRRKDVLRRVRLIDILHQNLHRKLTFVSAPAGYGKTTLLVDFAADVDAIVLWYRIGADDNDLVQFVRHLVAAFQQHIPQFGVSIEEKLNSLGSAPDSATLAIDFINEVEQKVEDFSLLVLDDYHLAGENQQIVDFVESLLEHLPDKLRLLMGSRSVYGIPTASLYIRDELVTISADELRFRADELQKLVLQNYRMRLSDEQAQEFATRADGWIVAILLALRTMENGILPKFNGGMEKMYEYLAEEVVNRQSEELRDFMLATSILSDFTEAQCNYLRERTDSATYLRSLEERNLFVSRTETSQGPSYRYHQLFSEFLQDYFARHQKPRLQALHRRAAEWHRQRGEWEAAIEHKLAAGDKKEAAQWIDAVAVDFYDFGRQALLALWADALAKAPDKRKDAPRLLLYQAKWLVNQSNFERSSQLLDIVEPVFRSAGNHEMQANVAITRGMIARFTGKHQDAIRLANQAQDLLAGKPHTLQWFQSERLKGLPNYFSGDVPAAIEHLKSAVTGFRKLARDAESRNQAQLLYDMAETLNDLGLVYINTGHMLEAQQAFRESLETHISIRSNLSALASAHNNMAYMNHQVGLYREAWKEYITAVQQASATNNFRVLVGVRNGIGELLLDLSEPMEAKQSFMSALSTGDSNENRPEFVGTFIGLARTERMAGNHNEAMNWLRRAASFPGAPLDESEYATELGSIYAEMNQDDLALKQFEIALSGWNDARLPKQSEVLAAYLSGCLFFKKKRVSLAQSRLEQALRGAAKLGYDQFLIIPTRKHQAILREFTNAFPSKQIEKLLERVGNLPTRKSLLDNEADSVTEPLLLEVHGFGQGVVRKNGDLTNANIWRSNRARALFFYILDRGKVRKDTIGLDFWPDFSTGKISSNFHATLWRVRQALGFKDAITFEEDQYFLHPSIGVWYDVAEFESYIFQAKKPGLTQRERVELLKQAVSLYSQPFLQDIYMEWADKRRDELKNLHLETLIDLAELEAKTGKYREAKRLYEKVIDVDPYRDEVHLSLMKTLVESGAPSAAIAHFKDYRSLLRKELNAEPLEELQEYYEQLTIKT